MTLPQLQEALLRDMQASAQVAARRPTLVADQKRTRVVMHVRTHVSPGTGYITSLW